MKDSELRTRAKTLALRVISVCDEIDTRKGRGILVNQITRSATSIGANINEANYASSKADFINKFHIALKECAETEYWIDMLEGSRFKMYYRRNFKGTFAGMWHHKKNACEVNKYGKR